MYIDLSGVWNISLEADEGKQAGVIRLPGILQASGYGNPVTRQTPWISSLHNPDWYMQEEYKYAQGEGTDARSVNVPFLSQPPRHFLGEAVYERTFTVAEESGEEWHFHVESARWRSRVWVDGEQKGEDCTLCGPHDIKVGRLSAGEHLLKVAMDNSMLYPYRPDAHGVSDALGATWNGMAGEIALFTEDEYKKREQEKREYAKAHPRTVEAKDGRFFMDGEPFYFRATHFGGEYPLTGYPATDKQWWRRVMAIIKEWGLNGIRFHSYCPPEAAFSVADEEDICLLVECGMWNHFADSPDGEEMFEVLRGETRRILENFGHHPSFAFFSPSNEPSGAWHKPLRRWVQETRAYDESLGYGDRRIYTAQSGWPYEVPPAEIEGTDFIYFHRAGGKFHRGGTIRGSSGWKGGGYSAPLEGVKKPVVCHELGQYCAYPNYSVIDKFTGYLQPGNYKVFRENARANGILPYADDFVKCSGENQVRLYKEDLEANFRTPEIQGFELLDLHDYLGQGTALVGILDVFWENKGYGSPEEFRNYCGDTVLLARCSSYVWKNTDTAVIPVEICHYGKKDIRNSVIKWTLNHQNKVLRSGELSIGDIPRGGNTKAGDIVLEFREMKEGLNAELNLAAVLCPGLTEKENSVQEEIRQEAVIVRNSWNLYVFAKQAEEICSQKETSFYVGMETGKSAFYTRDWQEAKDALEMGKAVVFNPYLSDLNYECPALYSGSVGWNSQMGPTWCRIMGVVVEESHPIFKYFPSKQSGGWQWEDILKHSRGFHMEGLEHVSPIVQPIDDWNRNLLQGLIFEARVLKGRLLVVSADLEGQFEDRPAAYTLKQAILEYAASEEFAPVQAAEPGAIERKLFPMLRMGALTREISYGEGVDVVGGEALAEADPNTSVRVQKEAFPITITIALQKTVAMQGILYVPEQRDRNHAGFAKEYLVEVKNSITGSWEPVAEGTFLDTYRSQSVLFGREAESDMLRITIFSAYSCEDKYVWKETSKGWLQVPMSGRAILQMAGIHVLCSEEASHGDVYESGKKKKSKTKEIEL